MNSFWRKIGWLVRRRDREAELRAELQFHLDAEAEEREAKGVSREEARFAAQRDLGNHGLVAEDTRAAWGWTLVEQFAQDLRYTFRGMAQNRGFTALAVLSLALGIGANAAIYSFIDAILMRSLPVGDPQSLTVLNWRAKNPKRGGMSDLVMHSVSGSSWDDGDKGFATGIFPYPAFEFFSEQHDLFSSVFAYYPARALNVSIVGSASQVRGEYVSGDFFRGVATAPAAGRLLMAQDDRAGTPPVAVVSYGFSQARWGGAERAVGQQILINNVPVAVVGVTAPDFFGVDPSIAPDLFVPLHSNMTLEANSPYAPQPEEFLDKNYYWIEVMARLRPGVTREHAAAVLGPQFHNWVNSTASTNEERANLPVLFLDEGAGGLGWLRRTYSKPLYVLLALVGLVLAIACANIANLLLARAAVRQREMAVRLSLGASRARVIRQLLTESVVLACAGGGLGVLCATWGVRFLTAMLRNGRDGWTLHAELNWHVLLAAFGLSLLTGVIFGLAPALQSTRVDVMPVLKEVRSAAGRARWRLAFMRVTLSQALVAAQIAISLVMLVAAGLFIHTLTNLHSIQLGFNSENLLLFELNARSAGQGDNEIAGFYTTLRQRTAAIPGVRQATLSRSSLLEAGHGRTVKVDGVYAPKARLLVIGADFFKTMQIPIRLGREIDERDELKGSAVAVVSELFAKTYLGEGNPLGRRISIAGTRAGEVEVVGVAAEAHYGGIKRNSPPVIYFPFTQNEAKSIEHMTYLLRTTGDPLVHAGTVRQLVHELDVRVPVTGLKTQKAEIDGMLGQEITFAQLCTGFSVLALVIACVGLYGMMSYTVARRTSEIGIRVALGARPVAMISMVLRQVAALAIAGLAVGVPTAIALSKLVKSFLYRMKPEDPWALASATLILLAAALIAGFAPARRAARVDPVVALRHE
jgi:predicted permease